MGVILGIEVGDGLGECELRRGSRISDPGSAADPGSVKVGISAFRFFSPFFRYPFFPLSEHRFFLVVSISSR